MMGVVIPLIGVLFGYTCIFLKVRSVRLKIRTHRINQLATGANSSTVKDPHTEPKTRWTRPTTSAPSGADGAQTRIGPSSTKGRRPAKPDFKQEDVKLAKTLFAAFLVFFISWYE